MKTTNNIILITGGGSGIGFEIAKLFSNNNNQIIITGRNEERLKKAVSQLENTTYIVSDVSKKDDVESLVIKIQNDFPQLNEVVNIAGRAFVYNLAKDGNAFEKAEEEMLTNYLSVIRLNEKLLPILSKQPEAAIVTISSIATITPNAILASYAASKAIYIHIHNPYV
jgi:uncharacterized oxidoreductase